MSDKTLVNIPEQLENISLLNLWNN